MGLAAAADDADAIAAVLAGVLPPASGVAVAWWHPYLGVAQLMSSPAAGDAVRERARRLLDGASPSADIHPADLVWEEGASRIVIAADPADALGEETLAAWRALALPLVRQRLQAEVAQLRVEPLAKSERLQQALYEIADLSGSSMDMHEMLTRIHAIVALLMSAENFYIVLYDEAGGTVRFLYFADQMDSWRADPDEELPVAQLPASITVALLRHGQPMMGPSAQVRARLGVPRDASQGPDSAAWLGVPMRRDGRISGAIVVQNYERPDSYSQEDRVLLEYVAQHILTALDRKHAQAELERGVAERTLELRRANQVLQAEIVERQRAERLQRALFRISELSVSAGSLDRFYADVHQVVGGLLYARNFYVAMVGNTPGLIEFPYSVDEHDRVRSARQMVRGLTEFVVASGEPLLADRSTIMELEFRGEIERQGTLAHCWLGVPLALDGRVVGVIAVQSYSREIRFRLRDQRLLTFVAHHIGSALSRKRAQQSLEAAHAELESRVEARTRELEETNRELREQINERLRAEQRLLEQARHDGLSGLPNRLHLLEKLDAAITRMGGPEELPFAVLFLDLDRFKLVNDSVGHAAGDDMLVEVGRRVRRVLSSGDTVARLGGDEFAVLLENVATPKCAQAAAERLQIALSRPMWIAGRELFPSASIGIAVWQPCYRFGEELLRDADAAMYRAKANGRDRCVLFDEEMRAEAGRLLDLEADLRRAIINDDFEPYFQPIVRLDDGTIVGHEALLRWNHELRGPLSPRSFIGVGEDSGLIEQVDWVMYAHVVRWLSRQPEGYVSINVSPRHFQSEDFAERLLRMVDDAGADPARLRIEITEVALLDDAPRALRMLEILRARGVMAQLDDFGTGFSALSYLHRFPIQSLKIDQSFVAGLDGETRTESLALVRAILALAGTLGIETIGEGVETAQQAQVLVDLGCQYAQGFLYGYPAPAVGAVAGQRLAGAL